jgi:hypothetical protein
MIEEQVVSHRIGTRRNSIFQLVDLGNSPLTDSKGTSFPPTFNERSTTTHTPTSTDLVQRNEPARPPQVVCLPLLRSAAPSQSDRPSSSSPLEQRSTTRIRMENLARPLYDDSLSQSSSLAPPQQSQPSSSQSLPPSNLPPPLSSNVAAEPSSSSTVPIPQVEGDPKVPKKQSSKMFRCTGFGECQMTFTRSEHLARHVRQVYPPDSITRYENSLRIPRTQEAHWRKTVQVSLRSNIFPIR